jgi:hypothetical protein
MRLTSLLTMVLVLCFGSIATAINLQVDLSCPDHAASKKGGDWLDFEVSGGCDGDRHDPRSWTDPGSLINFVCGQPEGHGNLITGGGDPIANSAYQHWEGASAPMILRISGAGHTAGDYTIEVLHAWNGGSITGLTVSGADSYTIIQPGQVVNTGSDADLLAAIGSHTLVNYSIGSNGQSVTLEWSGVPKINAWMLTPEPATIMLLGLGGLALLRRRR